MASIQSKILFIQNIDGIAGSENYFLAIIPELIKKGIDVHFLIVNLLGETQRSQAKIFRGLLEEKKVPTHQIGITHYGSPFLLPKISKLLRQQAFKIVHSHLIYADFWASMVKKFFIPDLIIVSTKHGYQEKVFSKFALNPQEMPHNLYYHICKFCEKQIDYSYACSYGLGEFYEKAGLFSGKMPVVQHGFNYPELTNSSNERFRYSKNQIVIVGRLIRRKGHHFVINRMPSLIQKFPDLKLVIVGEGSAEDELKDLVRSLHLEDSVVFEGYKRNIMDYMQNSDILIMPSYSEGLPLTIFEAFNSKCPVITFDTIGCNEAIENNVTGIIVPAYDSSILETKIEELLLNHDLRKQLAEAAYQRLKSYFSLERMTKDTYSLYEKIVQNI